MPKVSMRRRRAASTPYNVFVTPKPSAGTRFGTPGHRTTLNTFVTPKPSASTKFGTPGHRSIRKSK